MGRGEVFQGVQGFFRFAFLHHTHNGVENDDEQDQYRLKELHGVPFHAGDDKGDGGSQEQDEDHNVLKLFDKALEISLFLLFLEFVGAVLFQQCGGLLRGEALLGVGRKGL